VRAPLSISRQDFSVAELLRIRPQLQIDPPYQREGRIWTRERQQLLIDSIINGFDIPRIYLHRLRPPRFDENSAKTFAVVDGRQRLETIWDFAEGTLRLAQDFVVLDEEENPAQLPIEIQGRYGGWTMRDLELRAPHLYFRFLDYPLSFSIVDTDAEPLIEELFFRLNEGVPLTPAEKRNRGELLRDLLTRLVQEEQVFSITRIANRRQSHDDLLLRLMFLEESGVSREQVPDMKKRALDEFAASFRPGLGAHWNPDQNHAARERLNHLADQILPVISAMRQTFDTADPLLASVTGFLVYYLAFRELVRQGDLVPTREQFVELEETIASLRGVPEEALSTDALDLMEQFGQPVQGSTTGSYLRQRVEMLLRYLNGQLDIHR
jgi:hypothetical protein